MSRTLKAITSTLFLLVLLISFMPQNANAARIVRVKKGKVLLKLSKKETRRFKVREVYPIKTKRGKKRGEIEIIKIKGRKAVGKVLSGRAHKAYFVSSKQKAKQTVFKGDNVYIGGLLGFSSNKIVKADTALEGSAISYKLFYDYPFMESIWLRLSGGIQGFKVEDLDDPALSADIPYISLDAYARYMFSKSNMRPWIGGYMAGLFPTVTETPALKSVGTTSNYGVAFGLDYAINAKMMIPIIFEYNFFPKSETGTETTSMNLRFGFGYSF